MKLLRWAFVAALIGVVIAVVLRRSAGPAEPGYNGRSLSSWLNEWGKSGFDRTNAAAIAILQIGSNGVPLLMARLSEEGSPAENDLLQAAGNLIPTKLNPMNRRVSRSLEAAQAINLLGADAKSAFPMLTNLLASGATPHQLPAAIGLAGMGHDGIAVLLPELTNQDWSARYSAAQALGEARSDFDKVVSALIKVVKASATNDAVSVQAAFALVQLHKEPERVIPVFEEFLVDPNARMRVFGVELLAALGTDAKPAVPRLLKLRSDPDSEVRQTAKEALSEIDPSAAGDGGLK
jgi:HEAT repeat protein